MQRGAEFLGSCFRGMRTNYTEGRGRWGTEEGSEPRRALGMVEGIRWLVASDILLRSMGGGKGIVFT